MRWITETRNHCIQGKKRKSLGNTVLRQLTARGVAASTVTDVILLIAQLTAQLTARGVAASSTECYWDVNLILCLRLLAFPGESSPNCPRIALGQESYLI